MDPKNKYQSSNPNIVVGTTGKGMSFSHKRTLMETLAAQNNLHISDPKTDYLKRTLLISERSFGKDFLTKVIQKHPESFTDTYIYDMANAVRHVEEPFCNFTRQNNSWMVSDMVYDAVKLRSFPIPEDTYVTPTINVSEYRKEILSICDNFLCINDSDICGVLSCAKYLEEHDIPFEKVHYAWITDYSKEGLLDALQNPLPFIEVWNQTKAVLLETGCEFTHEGSKNYISM